jgi:methylated-DNA-[protein]-cysteine S-methyltransferase
MLERTLYYKTIPSPVGSLRLMASDKGLCAVLFDGGRYNRVYCEGGIERNDDYPVLNQAEKQLNEYFAGKRKTFDVPLDIRGSIFQLRAWRELQKIPYAETISYGEQARRIGDTKKARAAGVANGRNPICIIVPCHRVIGASGDLTGFAGGLKTKEFLLQHEKKNASKLPKTEAAPAKKRLRSSAN